MCFSHACRELIETAPSVISPVHIYTLSYNNSRNAELIFLTSDFVERCENSPNNSVLTNDIG